MLLNICVFSDYMFTKQHPMYLFKLYSMEPHNSTKNEIILTLKFMTKY